MYLGFDPLTQAGVQVITHLVSGALSRAAHARAKREAWENALQRIPEDDYIDYASYVKDHADLYEAWKTGAWHPARGGTQAEFGLIHIREFGPREGYQIKALKPGKRPAPGPVSPGAIGWPVSVLRKLPPLANPVPRVRGINDMTPAQQRRQMRRVQRQQANAGYPPAPPANEPFDLSQPLFHIGGFGFSPVTIVLVAGGGFLLYNMFNRGSDF